MLYPAPLLIGSNMTWEAFVAFSEIAEQVPNSHLSERIRVWRNKELDSSDWTQLEDSPITNKSEWAQYRQDLRNLPQQGADPRTWIFPTKPTS